MSAQVTSGMGAPPIGVAPWQVPQPDASTVETPQGSFSLPVPIVASLPAGATPGAAPGPPWPEAIGEPEAGEFGTTPVVPGVVAGALEPPAAVEGSVGAPVVGALLGPPGAAGS